MTIDSTKRSWIETYFRTWNEDLEKVKKLMKSQEFYLEAILLLCCYVGALAAARFPGRGDRESYKKIVNRYSGLNYIYNKVDLLFLYQWPRSAYRRSKGKHAIPYRKIKGYTQIKRKLVRRFGSEQTILSKPKHRYVTILTLLKHLDPFPMGLSREKILKTLELFTVSEIFYRYFRCLAVHENSLPLIGRVSSVNGTERFEDNHIITGIKIHETVRNIIDNLQKECISKNKFPWDLRNR